MINLMQNKYKIKRKETVAPIPINIGRLLANVYFPCNFIINEQKLFKNHRKPKYPEFLN